MWCSRYQGFPPRGDFGFFPTICYRAQCAPALLCRMKRMMPWRCQGLWGRAAGGAETLTCSPCWRRGEQQQCGFSLREGTCCCIRRHCGCCHKYLVPWGCSCVCLSYKHSCLHGKVLWLEQPLLPFQQPKASALYLELGTVNFL